MAKKSDTKQLSTNKDHYALDFTKHEVTELILWRNSASTRVDRARARMEKLAREYEDLNKKSHKDIKWIRKLHNELARKVFGHRPHINKLPKESPIQRKIEHHLEEIVKLSEFEQSLKNQ